MRLMDKDTDRATGCAVWVIPELAQKKPTILALTARATRARTWKCSEVARKSRFCTCPAGQTNLQAIESWQSLLKVHWNVNSLKRRSTIKLPPWVIPSAGILTSKCAGFHVFLAAWWDPHGCVSILLWGSRHWESKQGSSSMSVTWSRHAWSLVTGAKVVLSSVAACVRTTSFIIWRFEVGQKRFQLGIDTDARPIDEA